MVNPITWLKQLIQFRKYNQHLSDVIWGLHKDLDKLKAESAKPEFFISNIIGRGIEWFDYKKLDQGQKMIYYADCQNIVNSETFTNELNHYITDLVKFNANEAKDFDAVMNIRASIVALETFKERLSKIENPNKINIDLDKFSAI